MLLAPGSIVEDFVAICVNGSREPVLDPQSGHPLKIAQIAGEEQLARAQRNRRDPQICGPNAKPESPQLLELRGGGRIERQDRSSPQILHRALKLGVCGDRRIARPRTCNASEPATDMFLDADNCRRDPLAGIG